MKDLNILRQEIDTIDDQIVELIFRRFQITNEIGHVKLDNSLPAFDNSREKQIISRLEEKSRVLSLNPELISSIYSLLLSETVLEHKKRINPGP